MEINIRRDTGQLIPFTSHVVRVILHFRRRAFFNMLLPMKNQFYAYPQHVALFIQQGDGNISVYGGTHPYSQGGNGVGGMFRSLSRTVTPFHAWKFLLQFGSTLFGTVRSLVPNKEKFKMAT